MSPPAPHVLVVVASLQRMASTRAVLQALSEQLRAGGCQVDLLDLLEEPLALFNPDTSHGHSAYLDLKARVEQADVYILGTPDYHGGMSGALKNFLDHFWN